MISVIMIGAIYMHLVKWNDTIGDVEWQILLLCVSLFFFVKGNKE